jgi:isopentenyl diphosphate isomerase/L-lactate dehydrogenase-like FMN-dependent dehydrogenase
MLEPYAIEAHSRCTTMHENRPPLDGLGRERQADLYLGALRGRRPAVPVAAELLEDRARKVMSRKGFAYVAGGAGLETTIEANRAAFERWQIVPRVLRDTSARDCRVELFSRKLSSPFLLAPIGVLEAVHRDADRAVARAAAADDVPMIFSNQASVAMEECADVMEDAPRWFQLYWSTSNELVASLVRRAEACGCGAIVVTLDTTQFGWRPRDLDLGFLPFALGQGMAQYTSDPVFNTLIKDAKDTEAVSRERPTVSAVRSLIELARTYPGPFWSNLVSPRPRAAVRLFLETYSRPSLGWDDLSFLRGLTSMPILLKGILDPDDARTALAHGANGIVVSNHGGRQVDGAIASLDALPAIVEAVGEEIPILLDSGIRGGADAFKALALGARAVLIGRPYVYGLGIAGEHGVREVIRNFRAEFDLTMGLAGCASVAEIKPSMLARTG